MNNASELTVHVNSIFIYTVHANCIVQHSAISMHSKYRAAKCCFFFVTDAKNMWGPYTVNCVFFITKRLQTAF